MVFTVRRFIFSAAIVLAAFTAHAGEPGTLAANDSREVRADGPDSSEPLSLEVFKAKYFLFRTVRMGERSEAWIRLRSEDESVQSPRYARTLRRLVTGDSIEGWKLISAGENEALFQNGERTVKLAVPEKDLPPTRMTPPGVRDDGKEAEKGEKQRKSLEEMFKEWRK